MTNKRGTASDDGEHSLYRRGQAVHSTGGVDMLYYRNNPCGKKEELSTAMEEKDWP